MKTAVLTIAFILSSGAALYFYNASGSNGSSELLKENEALSAKVMQLEKQNQQLKSDKRKSELQLSQLEKKVTSLEKLVDKVSEVKIEQAEKSVQEKSTAEIVEEKVEEELSEAELNRRKQLQKFLSKEIDKNYKDLFESMGFSEEEIANIKSKLLERDTDIVSAVFKSIMQSLPTEEGQTQEQALAKSILDSIEKTNAELAIDLGDSFGEFREQEKIGFTLKELGNFEGMLAGDPLGDEQRQELNSLMFEHHNSVLQNVASGATTFKQADEELVKKSGEYLNPDQQKTLSNFLKMKRGGN